MKIRYPVVIFMISLALAACSPAAGRSLNLRDPWARPGVSGANSAVYFIIENGLGDDLLLAVDSDVSDVAQIHETQVADQVVRMVPQESVLVPAGGRVAFEPGGLHIMLVGINRDLLPGDTIRVSLTFENAGVVTLTVPVEER